MATPLNGTVIITGSNGALGSKVALKIARQYPFVHLLLTAHNVWDPSVGAMSEEIRQLGPRSFEIAELDHASFHSIRKFTKCQVDRVRSGDIPSVQLLINCEDVCSFKADAPTEDGFDFVYQTNCLGPFLLTTNLLEAFRVNDGDCDSGTRIINIGSSMMSMGKLDYFETQPTRKVDTPLGIKEGLMRYGSSKLLLNAAMYALRRSLVLTSSIDLTIFTLEPGKASSNDNISTNAPMRYRMTNGLKKPLNQMFSNSSRPAEALVKIAFAPLKHDRVGDEKYFVLDREHSVRQMVRITDDHEFMDVFLNQTVVDVGLGGD